MNPYESWLVRQRIYCEDEGCWDSLIPAVRVKQINGHDYVLCEEHARRVEARRAQAEREMQKI